MHTPAPQPGLRAIFMNGAGKLSLNLLKKHCGIANTQDIVHAALGVTALSLALGKQGYSTCILHDGGVSAPVNPAAIQKALWGSLTDVRLALTPEAGRALDNVKRLLSTNDDSEAVGFALSFAQACTAGMAEARDGRADYSARIFLTKSGDHAESGIFLTQQPFDIRNGKPFNSVRSPEGRKVRARVKPEKRPG